MWCHVTHWRPVISCHVTSRDDLFLYLWPSGAGRGRLWVWFWFPMEMPGAFEQVQGGCFQWKLTRSQGIMGCPGWIIKHYLLLFVDFMCSCVRVLLIVYTDLLLDDSYSTIIASLVHTHTHTHTHTHSLFIEFSFASLILNSRREGEWGDIWPYTSPTSNPSN